MYIGPPDSTHSSDCEGMFIRTGEGGGPNKGTENITYYFIVFW